MTEKIKCLNDGFVQLIDHMGSDASICNAARVSYGNHEQDVETLALKLAEDAGSEPHPAYVKQARQKLQRDNKRLIRYLMSHRHTTPFEMVSFIFLVRAPIHVARQWFRHRTWSYNEYSTRYKEAIDSFETTEPDAWRKQATDNKQGSDGFIKDWPEGTTFREECDDSGKHYVATTPDGTDHWDVHPHRSLGEYLSHEERNTHRQVAFQYSEALELGVAREQARKDLPLSIYTEFYAKVDLHNLFHFLSLRLDSHAQLEIQTYGEVIAKIIKPLVPISYQAFEDYRLNGSHFSAEEMKVIKYSIETGASIDTKPDSMTKREWKGFLTKISE